MLSWAFLISGDPYSGEVDKRIHVGAGMARSAVSGAFVMGGDPFVGDVDSG